MTRMESCKLTEKNKRNCNTFIIPGKLPNHKSKMFERVNRICNNKLLERLLKITQSYFCCLILCLFHVISLLTTICTCGGKY